MRQQLFHVVPPAELAEVPPAAGEERHPLLQADDLERLARRYERQLPALRQVVAEAVADLQAAEAAIAAAREWAAELVRLHAGPRWRPLARERVNSVELAAALEAAEEQRAERAVAAAMAQETALAWVRHPLPPDSRDAPAAAPAPDAASAHPARAAGT